MSSKLMTAALAALMLGATGLASADNNGRGGRHGDGDRHGWNRGGPPAHGHPGQFRHGAPYAHQDWNRHGPPYGHAYGYGHPKHYWKHGHGHPRHGYYAPHAKRYADYGDDITIIFRGRLD